MAHTAAHADPSSSVNGDLLPHIHLISTYKYPVQARLEIQDVSKWLQGAQRVARDGAPFYWTYLESPPDGSIFLTWQPLMRRGENFASDGYIWPFADQVVQHNVGGGMVLEIYFNKQGFRMGEPYVTHSRRRCRLVAMPGAMPNPVPDPSLWIVHYGPADQTDRIPTKTIPITPQVQQSIHMRQQLLSMGQIVRKEFVLSDRVNWPQIPFPGRGNPMYAPPPNARSLPQTMAYPPQGHPGPGPASKRRGVPPLQQNQGGQMPMVPSGSMQPPEFAFDDDEDTTKGDLFDHLTPRDVAIARYQQNHEWMEEVLSSPYGIGRIVVPDLGIGLRGELASLTDGIFESQGGNAVDQAPKKPYIGHLDPGLADQFRQRVNEKVETTNSEMEKMKAEHEKRMAKFRRNALFRDAEEELRSAREPGWEMFRLEDGQQDNQDEGGSLIPSAPSGQLYRTPDDILRGVEKAMGKHVSIVSQVHRVQAGGYAESIPEPEPAPAPPAAAPGAAGQAMSRHPSQAGSPQSGIMVGDSDMDGGGTAAGLLDQMHTGFSSTSTPNNGFPTPGAGPSAAGTPVNLGIPSPHPGPSAQPAASEDVDMEDASAPKQPANNTVPDQGTGSGDWVVVPNENTSATTAAPLPPGQPHTEQARASSKPASAAPTPGFDSNDFSSLGDLDTAGEALAGYDPPSIDATGGHDDGLDLSMDMEDSAFGDAFHGVGAGAADGNSAANTPADGGM